MRATHDRMRLNLSHAIFNKDLTIANANQIPPVFRGFQPEEIYFALGDPPQVQLGDLTLACFPFAKKTKMPPPVIAKSLAEICKQIPEIDTVQAAGPYLNLKLKPEILGQEIASIFSEEMFSRSLLAEKKKTMIEYSQPNTHKELHVGHMRNLCLGNALVRIFQYAQIPTVASTFPGDSGTHVAKCLWYLKNFNKEPIPSQHRGEWIGKMYSLGSLKLEDELGTEKEIQNRAQLTEILRQLESKKGPYFDLWIETREWSIDLMNRVYAWAGVKFDKWYWESEVDTPSVQYVKKCYADGKLSLSEGAIGMDLNAEGLGFCLLLKSDGNGLYATKDLELARRKFEDFGIERNIYVVDVRQTLHFQQVFKTMEKLGFAQAKECFHLQYNFVELPDGAMSSRKGNIVPLTQLVHQMETTVKENYLNRYDQDSEPLSDSEKVKISHEIADGAIKYGMLKIDNNKKIVFEMSEWLKLEGDTGPYIQYAHARIYSLCLKLGVPTDSIPNWNLLSEKERPLLLSLLKFNHSVLAAYENLRPSILCNYLYELAKVFSSFYHDCPIAKANTEDEKKLRLYLASATGIVLKRGLALLGIQSPTKM